MADWSKPITGDTYADIISEIRARDEDVAKQFDGTTSSNIPTDAIRWNSTNKRWEKWNGTQWNPLSSTYNIDLDFAPYGTISSTTVINAIKELADEKLDKSGGTMTGTLIFTPDKYGGWGGRSGSPAINLQNGDVIGINSLVFNDVSYTSVEGVMFPITGSPTSLSDYCGFQGKTDREPYWVPDASSSSVHKIWHAGNDGSGSGLDADKLDGYESSSFLRKAEAVPVRDSARNLVITNNSTSPYTKMDVSFDELILEYGSGNPYRAQSGSFTIDFSTNGANGLDSGSMTANTWYHLWCISNGTAVAGLASISSTLPTLPSGYTYKAYLGAVRTDSSGNLEYIYQTDKRVACQQKTAGNVTGSNTSLDLSAIVPSTAKWVCGWITCNYSSGSGSRNTVVYYTPDGGTTRLFMQKTSQANQYNGGAKANYRVPIRWSSGTPYIDGLKAGDTGTSATSTIYVAGWEC